MNLLAFLCQNDVTITLKRFHYNSLKKKTIKKARPAVAALSAVQFAGQAVYISVHHLTYRILPKGSEHPNRCRA